MPARTHWPRPAGQRAAPVRAAGLVPEQLLLPVLPGGGGEPGPDATVGPVASGPSGLWQSQVDGASAPGGFEHQSQADGAVAAPDGDRSDLRQTQDESAGAGPSDLSISVARFGSDRARSGLVFGHHLCADGGGVHVFGGGDGLVESLRKQPCGWGGRHR